MLFNSLEFLLFLPTVFVLYWFVFKNQLRAQNILLLVASYVFYGWWDWRFLSLIVLSTAIDYLVGLQLEKTAESSKRKLLLGLSLTANLGMLGFFKYFNFFVQSWVDAWASVGVTMQGTTLEIILPVGISFYTFQTLSYTIDIYRKQLQPTKSFIDFAAFVTFFPQLVAGPIERASHLLPQIYKKRVFQYEQAVAGVQLIIWGMFKKVVVADNCAFFVNPIFENPAAFSSGELAVGMVFFAFQIYGDFSGYSDIAIGVSKLFGFDLMVNFKFPYFSRDIAEFWRRWHISLSTWFRDYLYIPLGGSKGGTKMKIRNTFIIFIVSGFWHGANWTFIVWGALNAIYFLPLLLANKNRSNINIVAENSYFPSIREFFGMLTTFSLTVLAWVFFRADNISHAFVILNEIFSTSLFQAPSIDGGKSLKITAVLTIIFVIVEWFGRSGEFALDLIGKSWKRPIRWGFYYVVLMAIFWFTGKQQEFIYFQF